MNRIENEHQDLIVSQPLNRQYKDRLFRVVFRDKKDLLDLYNAINGTDYQNEEELIITTLEDVIYLGMKNDMSFMIGASMNLYEQQSTWNENMPLRGLIYFAGLYQAYITQNRYNLYGSRRIPLPVPRYIVFYNGAWDKEDRMVLKLSDAFVPQGRDEKPCLECEATIFNINKGHNRELLKKCRRLGEYTEFVTRVRKHLEEGGSVETAVKLAMDECLKDEILVDVLTRCRTEVLEVLLTEYNEEETREYLRREAIEEGLKQGLEQGLEEGLKQGIKTNVEICRELGLSKEETYERISSKYILGADEIQKYVDQYWKEIEK